MMIISNDEDVMHTVTVTKKCKVNHSNQKKWTWSLVMANVLDSDLASISNSNFCPVFQWVTVVDQDNAHSRALKVLMPPSMLSIPTMMTPMPSSAS